MHGMQGYIELTLKFINLTEWVGGWVGAWTDKRMDKSLVRAGTLEADIRDPACRLVTGIEFQQHLTEDC